MDRMTDTGTRARAPQPSLPELGWAVGQSFDGTVVPLLTGYVVLSAIALAIVAWTERGRLFEVGGASDLANPNPAKLALDTAELAPASLQLDRTVAGLRVHESRLLAGFSMRKKELP